ncbi:MAG: N-acetyltransferase family protein [Bacteroides sp.]|nr:N-acetyltransferase family protein [Bacteroides sp.]
MKILLHRICEKDLETVRDIYNYYILHSTAVYYTQPICTEELRTFLPVGDPKYHSYLIQSPDEEILGFCYYAPFKPKDAFRISVEFTLYLRPHLTGKGIGYQVMLLTEPVIYDMGFSNIVALISGDNEPSIRMFEKCGYERCACIRQVAEKFGKKLDLVMYQKLLPDH